MNAQTRDLCFYSITSGTSAFHTLLVIFYEKFLFKENVI